MRGFHLLEPGVLGHLSGWWYVRFTGLMNVERHQLCSSSHSACDAPLFSRLLQTPVTYCAANTSDLECVVQHVRGLYPEARVLGAGVSMGG